MNAEVLPFEAIGPLRLGMTVEELQAAGNLECRRCGGFTERHLATVMVGDIAKAIITRNGICVFLEVWLPMNPVFQGRHVFRTPYPELHDWLAGLDPDLEPHSSGLISRNLGIGLWAPEHKDDPKLPPEFICTFERGYYEKDYTP